MFAATVISENEIYTNGLLNVTNISNLIFINSSSGNVGIGTNNPNFPLEIINNLSVINAISYNNGTGYHTRVDLKSSRGTRDIPTYLKDKDEVGVIVFREGTVGALGAGAGMAGFASEDWDASNLGQELYFFVTPNGSNDTKLSALKILNTGDVYMYNRLGITTTDPSTLLHITNVPNSLPSTSGNDSSDTGTRLQRITSNLILDTGLFSTNTAWIQSRNALDYSINLNLLLNPNGGNVGIGTTSPSAKLDINGTIKLRSATEPTCNSTNAGTIYYNSTTNKHRGCNSTTWNDLY